MLAVMTMPSLLLQKSHKTSKAKEHVACLTRRLYIWKAGDLQSLLEEGREIQQRIPLRTSTHHTTEKFSRIFTKMVLEGKLKTAIRLLSNFQEEAGVLNLNALTKSGDTVLDILKKNILLANKCTHYQWLLTQTGKFPLIRIQLSSNKLMQIS